MNATRYPEALLVLPHLYVQNANAISSPLTHGFPSITAFVGLMWALQRKLDRRGIPLKLEKVGVICHRHEEQAASGYVKTFRLTRNPVGKDGNTAAIVEEGRIHLDMTVIFQVTQPVEPGKRSDLTSGNEERLKEWAEEIGVIVSSMRIAGGTILPPVRGQRAPWMEVLPDDSSEQVNTFVRWRRRWLPGYALVERSGMLAERHRKLRETRPEATLLDAWLHAARFNYQPDVEKTSKDVTTGSEAQHVESKKVHWSDPARPKGSGWIVPIPVGYAALEKEPRPAGNVANARDASIPFVFVEPVYSIGEWISPHRLSSVNDLLWQPEFNAQKGLYRCCNRYRPDDQIEDEKIPDDDGKAPLAW